MSPHLQDLRVHTLWKLSHRPRACRRHRRPESRCPKMAAPRPPRSTAPRPSSARAATSGTHPETRSPAGPHRQPTLHRARRLRCSRGRPPGRSAPCCNRAGAARLTLARRHHVSYEPSPRSVEVGRVARRPRPPSGPLPLVSRKLRRTSHLPPRVSKRRPAPRSEAAARPASTLRATARQSAFGVARGPHLPQQSLMLSTRSPRRSAPRRRRASKLRPGRSTAGSPRRSCRALLRDRSRSRRAWRRRAGASVARGVLPILARRLKLGRGCCGPPWLSDHARRFARGPARTPAVLARTTTSDRAESSAVCRAWRPASCRGLASSTH